LRGERGLVASVFNHVVGTGGLQIVRNLVGDAGAGVGFGSGAGFWRNAEAGDVARDAEAFGRGDDDDAVHAASPVGQQVAVFTACMGVALHLKDERGDDDGDGGGVVREELVGPLALRFNDGGVDDGVQLLQAAFRERDFSKPAAVE